MLRMEIVLISVKNTVLGKNVLYFGKLCYRIDFDGDPWSIKSIIASHMVILLDWPLQSLNNKYTNETVEMIDHCFVAQRFIKPVSLGLKNVFFSTNVLFS